MQSSPTKAHANLLISPNSLKPSSFSTATSDLKHLEIEPTQEPTMVQRIEMSFVLVLVTMFLARASAQSSCTNVIISMSPCLNYITGNSSTPSSGCCSQLASVVLSSPQCLCQVLNGSGSSLGINVNQSQARALPGACNVQTPPVSQCNAASPADSPAGTPDDSSNTVPSGTGSKTVPSTDDGSSDGNSIKFSMTQLIVLFASALATLSMH